MDLAFIFRLLDKPADLWQNGVFDAGFQTHSTPVLLNAGERAELGTEKYVAMSSALEGIVILKPNPNYVEPDTKH